MAKLSSFSAALTTQVPFEFKLLANLNRMYPLMMISAIESGTPFLRMVVLTHFLPLKEVGFVSVLTAFVAFLELSTDLAIYRFVYSIPKERFEEALASAHALAIVRGFVVCLLALCAAPFVASALSLGEYWTSFALLAPTILLRSFESLATRVAERDFQYWPQVKAAGWSFACALVVLFAVALITRNHLAIIASVYAQTISAFFTTRRFANVPYRVDFRSPLFKAAFKFGYPLVINGLGLSIAQQADRFIVAGFFNLQTVAVYSVVVLATTVPINLINRTLATTVLARVYHASSFGPWLSQEVRLASTLFAVVGALYASAVILMINYAVTLVFGAKFHVDNSSVILLGLAAFVRFVRLEPFTTVMLNSGRTKRLAISNVLVASSLAYMVLFSFFDRSINAVLTARLLGEVTGLAAAIYLTRRVADGGRSVFTLSTATGFLFVAFAGLESVGLERGGESLPLLLIACVAFAIPAGLWGAFDLRGKLGRLRAVIASRAQPQAGPFPR
jgi:O-antigen/teichoic acid export membrane protein